MGDISHPATQVHTDWSLPKLSGWYGVRYHNGERWCVTEAYFKSSTNTWKWRIVYPIDGWFDPTPS